MKGATIKQTNKQTNTSNNKTKKGEKSLQKIFSFGRHQNY